MPTKKKSTQVTPSAGNHSAAAKIPAVPKRPARSKKPTAPDQSQVVVSDTAPRGRVRRAKSAKAEAEFDEIRHHAEIAHEAYLLWLGRDCAHGKEFEDWIQAVEIVRQRHQT